MTLPQIISRNTVQTIPTTALIILRVLSPFTFYTCPTGKKAVISGRATCTSLGAASDCLLNAAGVEIAQWSGTAIGDRILEVNNYFPFDLQLDAGDTLDYSQDSGTNSQMLINVRIQESPI